ncbi:hypothetical protein [Pseudogemmobacter faecipullorum]|uniref:Uncharacterized protein n=1 Tax=Pseudogemmobacter faecipullorum TaxID=2755041 RepID=A0ABS8CJK7_9RHOB|nr:hypothetical protein [Pseudogemmobacter faecipullorum]MCB5409561.1 hypothetical protein [Pseudogemmobacter faecipullorum]
MRHFSPAPVSALAAVALLAGLPAFADRVRVRGGEHADFTRIVIELPGRTAWSLQRNGRSYIFRSGAEDTGWALDHVFDLIPATRLKAVIPAKEAGALELQLGCDCHATAFEARPQVIAIDIREGPGAPESVPDAPAPESATMPDRPWFSIAPAEARPGYDWLQARHGLSAGPLPVLASRPRSGASLGLMRDAVLRQISRGIVEGVITPVSDRILPDPAARALQAAGELRVSNGEMPGLRLAPDPAGKSLTDQGRDCVADAALALADWYPAQPAALAIADARQALFAEFDRPVPQQILLAARLHLALGFGAEARQMLRLLPGPEQPEAALLATLSWLVDLQPPPANIFSGMESCDGAAALWASLALALAPRQSALPPGSFKGEAVFQAFSTLPAALKSHLGPALAGYFLQIGDEAGAYRIRDVLRRQAPGPDAATRLLTGQLLLREGAAAADQASAALAESTAAGAGALILLVDAAFAEQKPLSPDLPDQIAAYRQEVKNDPSAPLLLRAELLAAALAGDFDRAFALLPAGPENLPALWQLVVAGADDDFFLREALTPPFAPVPPALRQATARRLLQHGFASEALAWLAPPRPEGPEAAILAAEAALLLRDARSALTYLSEFSYESPPEQVVQLRQKAALQLGQDSAAPPVAAPPASAAGPGAEADAELPVAPAALPDWAAAAETALSAAGPGGSGLLARSYQLAEDAAARAGAVEKLREIARLGSGNGLETPQR